MKQTIRLLLMALPIVLGLASCAEKDNPVDPNPLAKQVSGLWWSLSDQKGTLPDYFEITEYSRLGMAYQFNEDGTGYGIAFFFNNESGDPLDYLGGETIATLSYTTTTDGRIKVEMTNPYFSENKFQDDFFKQWTMAYADGSVTATNGTQTLTFEKPNDAIAAKIHEWDQQFNSGFEMESFNPNDVDFNHDTWRKQTGIYLYDGVGPKIITYDGSQYRFTGVELPWNAKSSNSNLPMNFCDDITPENGWDLVMNYCGDTSETNRNFFALYNKWTGILRFFTYVPKGFASGNDHLWEVIISGQTGMRQGLPYGLPLDKTVVDPSAIDMDTDGSSHFVSPWVSKRSTDKLITPRAGWWAFDVDMSQYQPGLDMSDDMIRLQMLSWTKENATFFSELMADLDGSISADINTKLTDKASMYTQANEAIQILSATGSMIGNAYQGNVGLVFTNWGNMTDHLFTLAGKNKSTTTFEGSINMTLKGNITTSGILEKSDPVTGVSSPTISFSEFDTENTMLGRGVWNLKTSPVVWLTDVGGSFGLQYYWKNNNPDMYYQWEKNSVIIPYYPDGSDFYFFDPSSIEVELNPDLFPASQVEWTQVEAYCVSHADNGVRGTDNYRKAFGLQPRSAKYFYSIGPGISDNDNSHFYFDKLKNVYDFLYYSDDKTDMDYPAIVSTPKYEGGQFHDGSKANGYYDVVVGRGKAGAVALEPMALIDGRNNVDLVQHQRIPALEVMVCLYVKLKGQSEPYIYVRHYLPEIKTLSVYRANWYDDYETRVLGAMNQVWQNLKSHQPKGTGINRQSPAYDYEMMRIGKVLNYINPDFKND